MISKSKEYFDLGNEYKIKPRTTMRCNRWFLSVGKINYGRVSSPTNYYDERDGLIDGKMLLENKDEYELPIDITHNEICIMACGPVGDVVEITTFKNAILKNTNTKNVVLLQFDSFEYVKD
jgi:hypothetical protein